MKRNGVAKSNPISYLKRTVTVIKKRITSILLIVLCLISVIVTPLTAFATSDLTDLTTSSVRDDLANMGEDKLSNLSSEKNIFLGMSQFYDKDNNLRTYLYLNYIGSLDTQLKVSISTAVPDEKYNITEVMKTYDLDFVNNDSTWVKYEILGLPNLDNVTRRYKLGNILTSSSILNIDQTYIFHGITNDTIEVFHQEIETITITDKEVRFFCYGEESDWLDFWGFDEMLGHNQKYSDAWYIFFSTDKPVDNLKEIEITYMPYDYHIQMLGGAKMNYAFTEDVIKSRVETGDFDEKTIISYGTQTKVTITPGTTKVSSSDNWWGGYETQYEEIDNIIDLRKYNYVADNGNPFVFSAQAEKYTWGVNFLVTDKESNHKNVSMMGNTATSCVVDGTGVCNTAILRLKYEINGIVKNAYVVDVPTNDFYGSSAEEEIPNSYKDLLKKVIAVVLFVLFAIVFFNIILPIVKPVFELAFKGLKYIVDAFLTIIVYPIQTLFKRNRK